MNTFASKSIKQVWILWLLGLFCPSYLIKPLKIVTSSLFTRWLRFCGCGDYWNNKRDLPKLKFIDNCMKISFQRWEIKVKGTRLRKSGFTAEIAYRKNSDERGQDSWVGTFISHRWKLIFIQLSINFN